LCEAIAEDDESAGDAVIEEASDTALERARPARAVISARMPGAAAGGWRRSR
jgi:hypothetical protein